MFKVYDSTKGRFEIVDDPSTFQLSGLIVAFIGSPPESTVYLYRERHASEVQEIGYRSLNKDLSFYEKYHIQPGDL